MKNRLSRWLLIAIGLAMGSFWWLLIDTDRGAIPPKPITIAELRTLATILPGPHPTSVNYTLLARRQAVGDVYAAGIGLKRRTLAVITWTLPVPGKGPVMIDPGAPPADADLGHFAHVDRAKLDRIDAAAAAAGLVLYTQGHRADSPRPIYQLGKAGMTIAAPFPQPTPPPPSYTTAQAVAPGVVLIPASSHAPGARLIFVQLADGREFLFAGNIAPLMENWTRLRARSHLAAAWGPAQNRGETYAWLRTIRQLRTEAPNMKIVPGHDYTWLTAAHIRGAIAEFQPAPAPPPPIARHPTHHSRANLS